MARRLGWTTPYVQLASSRECSGAERSSTRPQAGAQGAERSSTQPQAARPQCRVLLRNRPTRPAWRPLAAVLSRDSTARATYREPHDRCGSFRRCWSGPGNSGAAPKASPRPRLPLSRPCSNSLRGLLAVRCYGPKALQTHSLWPLLSGGYAPLRGVGFEPGGWRGSNSAPPPLAMQKSKRVPSIFTPHRFSHIISLYVRVCG